MFQESWYCAYPLCHSRCIIYILNPTSNHNVVACEKAADRLYIFWFLHQTTTLNHLTIFIYCCISFDSYIKPQHSIQKGKHGYVVYLLIPTSNHNYWGIARWGKWLYIFWFLHQTTTPRPPPSPHQSCISFDSYIKPQHIEFANNGGTVVYLLIPTSNHNCFWSGTDEGYVVYLLIPTSNHNKLNTSLAHTSLYIFWFLHQTTTNSK